MVVFRQDGCFSAKVVVFEQKWLYSGQSDCIRAKLLYSGKKWLYSGKVVLLGQRRL